MKSSRWRLLAIVVGFFTFTSQAVVRYVDVNSTDATPPFTNWATAAAVIQDAIDAAVAGDEILVTNGVYQTGGRAVGTNVLVNRVAVNKVLTLRSVNGPEFTMIKGYQVPGTTNGDGAVRCVYLTNDASLSGFTLTIGATRLSGNESFERSGGGVWGMSQTAVVTNCVIIGNSACSGGGASGGTLINCILANNMAFGPGFSLDGGMSCGGGAYGSTLDQCLLTNNSATAGGGVARTSLANCILRGNSAGGSMGGGGGWAAGFRNCTVTGNSTGSGGGGVSECNLYNSIVYYNTAPNSPDQISCYARNSCTTGVFIAGSSSNITSAPLFVDVAGGNLRLQPNSPCINAGNNAYAAGLKDFDGRPRVVGVTVDLGAYEFQPGVISSFIGWLQQYGLPTDGSADFADSDGDGMNNWQEWRASTVPTNALSALRMLPPTADVSGVTLSWQSMNTHYYWVERATNLTAVPPFSTLAIYILGRAGETTYVDTTAVGSGPFFYRVGVHE